MTGLEPSQTLAVLIDIDIDQVVVPRASIAHLIAGEQVRKAIYVGDVDRQRSSETWMKACGRRRRNVVTSDATHRKEQAVTMSNRRCRRFSGRSRDGRRRDP